MQSSASSQSPFLVTSPKTAVGLNSGSIDFAHRHNLRYVVFIRSRASACPSHVRGVLRRLRERDPGATLSELKLCGNRLNANIWNPCDT
jgi:hypothetical protein